MTPDERSELAALHALGLLEGEEAARAMELLRTDEAFAAEVAAFSADAAVMASAVAPVVPSDLLRERVLSMVKPAVRRSSISWIGWGMAAALGLSAVWLWTERSTLAHNNSKLTQELKNVREDSKLAGLRIATLEGQLDAFKGTRAVVVWDATRNEGRIHLTGLPAVEPGKDYQLWVVDPARKNPVSGGLIPREDDGTANIPFQPTELIHDASAFAISIERSGGVDVAQGPIVVLGK